VFHSSTAGRSSSQIPSPEYPLETYPGGRLVRIPKAHCASTGQRVYLVSDRALSSPLQGVLFERLPTEDTPGFEAWSVRDTRPRS
jgi:hypothetical protein